MEDLFFIVCVYLVGFFLGYFCRKDIEKDRNKEIVEKINLVKCEMNRIFEKVKHEDKEDST